MKFKQFARTATLVASISAVAMLTGCGKVIDEGNFGIEKYWGGEYNTETLGTGFKVNVFDTIYEVYARENLIAIADAKPKDKNGAILEDLDLTVVVRALKEGAIPFVLKTGDIAPYNDAFVIGSKYVQKDAQSVLGTTMQKFASEDMQKDKQPFEVEYKKDLQIELDKLYGKAFVIEEVKVSSIKVSKLIEEKIQAISAVQAETAKNEAVMKILASRESVLTQEATLLKRASEKSGISVENILQNELIKAVRENNNTNVQVSVPAAPAARPKP